MVTNSGILYHCNGWATNSEIFVCWKYKIICFNWITLLNLYLLWGIGMSQFYFFSNMDMRHPKLRLDRLKLSQSHCGMSEPQKLRCFKFQQQ